MFISRDKSRSAEDCFKLYVQPKLRNLTEAVPIYAIVSADMSEIIGWKIQNRFE